MIVDFFHILMWNKSRFIIVSKRVLRSVNFKTLSDMRDSPVIYVFRSFCFFSFTLLTARCCAYLFPPFLPNSVSQVNLIMLVITQQLSS